LTRTQPILVPTPNQLRVENKKVETTKYREQKSPVMPHVDTYLELIQYTLEQQRREKDEEEARLEQERDEMYARFQQEIDRQREYE